MNTNNRTPLQPILNWCRQHDWGVDAYLVGDQIAGIRDYYEENGVAVPCETVLPADMKVIRDWAGY